MSVNPSTDKFRKVKAYTATTLATSINGSDTSLTPASVTGWPTDAPVTIVIDRVDANGNPIPTKREVITGAVSGADLINCVRAQDSTTAQAHSAGAVIEILSTATDWNKLIEGLLAQHNQDGSHGAVTATSVSTDTINEKTTDAGVSVDGLSIKDGKLNTNNSVSEANLTDGIVSNAKLKTGAGEPGSGWTEVEFASVTGFSSLTNNSFKYIRIGKLIFYRAAVSGTSNSSSISVTLPAGLERDDTPMDVLTTFMTNNGAVATAPGRAWFSDENKFSVFRDLNATTWTNSGAKSALWAGFYVAKT